MLKSYKWDWMGWMEISEPVLWALPDPQFCADMHCISADHLSNAERLSEICKTGLECDISSNFHFLLVPAKSTSKSEHRQEDLESVVAVQMGFGFDSWLQTQSFLATTIRHKTKTWMWHCDRKVWYGAPQTNTWTLIVDPELEIDLQERTWKGKPRCCILVLAHCTNWTGSRS